MLTSVQNFIPVVTSEAGLCLTAANWQEAKVDSVSYSLEFLLHKPGYELLKKIPDLRGYLGWSGTLVLNAQTLKANREGIYLLKSPYDGSKVKLSALEFIQLVLHLKPDAIILPKNILRDCPQIWTLWDEAITPFFHVDDLNQQTITQNHGVYFQGIELAELALLDNWAHLPRYVSGDLDNELIHALRARGIYFIESNEPAQAALEGRVYTSTGEVDLTHANTAQQFEIIDAHCVCPSCSQKFTKAYFHHLLQHTPLLCQRFLIQHNVFWMANL